MVECVWTNEHFSRCFGLASDLNGLPVSDARESLLNCDQSRMLLALRFFSCLVKDAVQQLMMLDDFSYDRHCDLRSKQYPVDGFHQNFFSPMPGVCLWEYLLLVWSFAWLIDYFTASLGMWSAPDAAVPFPSWVWSNPGVLHSVSVSIVLQFVWACDRRNCRVACHWYGVYMPISCAHSVTCSPGCFLGYLSFVVSISLLLWLVKKDQRLPITRDTFFWFVCRLWVVEVVVSVLAWGSCSADHPPIWNQNALNSVTWATVSEGTSWSCSRVPSVILSFSGLIPLSSGRSWFVFDLVLILFFSLVGPCVFSLNPTFEWKVVVCVWFGFNFVFQFSRTMCVQPYDLCFHLSMKGAMAPCLVSHFSRFFRSLQRPDLWFYHNLRKCGISFDPDDVITMTKVRVPVCVKFVASLGPKFNFHHTTDERVDEIGWLSFKSRLVDMLDCCRVEPCLKDSILNLLNANELMNSFEPRRSQVFIESTAIQARKFLDMNGDLMISLSDKGGKPVIMDCSTYEDKINEHIKNNVDNGIYKRIDASIFNDIERNMLLEYQMMRNIMNERFYQDHVSRGSPHLFIHQEPFVMSYLTVNLKTHKVGMPPRPIVSASDRWAKKLSAWILLMLENILRIFNMVKVKNSKEFVEKLHSCRGIDIHHQMVTWDYESMFTNIDLTYPYQLIAEHYHEISKHTSVTVYEFLRLLEMLVDSTRYFTANGKIYKQEKGLTMGSDLSQALAEITTNAAAIEVHTLMGNSRMPLLCKYIDDFATLIREEDALAFENHLCSKIPELPLKRNPPEGDGSVCYLDVRILRLDGEFLTEWWQKDCSNKKILNFHSHHPVYMKRNIVISYIKHALDVTSKSRYQNVIRAVQKTLRRSSYPRNFVSKCLKSVLNDIGGIFVTSTYGTVDDENVCLRTEILGHDEPPSCNIQRKMVMQLQKPNYVSMPFHNDKALYLVNERLSSLPIRIAPTSTRPNKKRFFTCLKRGLTYKNVKRATFIIRCNDCTFKKICRTIYKNLHDTIQEELRSEVVKRHIHIFPSHTFSRIPVGIRRFNRDSDLILSFKHRRSNMV